MIKQDIKVSRITSTFDKGIYHIHVYGYDKQGNFKSYKDTFRNYFYYSAIKLKNHLKRKVRGTIHEADVNAVFRYILH